MRVSIGMVLEQSISVQCIYYDSGPLAQNIMTCMTCQLSEAQQSLSFANNFPLATCPLTLTSCPLPLARDLIFCHIHFFLQFDQIDFQH